MELFLHCRKTILFHNNNEWTKKGQKDFDITMGGWDGAECCELVSLYLLKEISESGIITMQDIGMYRGDGIGVFKGSSPQLEQFKKKLLILLETMV